MTVVSNNFFKRATYVERDVEASFFVDAVLGVKLPSNLAGYLGLNLGKAITLLFVPALSVVALIVGAQTQSNKPSAIRPAVTRADLKIAHRAGEILNTAGKWNRSDNRVCPIQAKTFSLYCAIEKATSETGNHFEHRSAAMQEARFTIEEVDLNWRRYEHRLKDYNNDPQRTFADIQKVLRLLEERIAKRLGEERNARD